MRVRWKVLFLLASPLIVLLLLAWTHALLWGIDPSIGKKTIELTPPDKLNGFPWWIILTHYVNFLLLFLVLRSGLQILFDHPRLYWNRHCTPGTEWLSFAWRAAPRDPDYTSKDDAQYLPPWIGIPGGRHTIGMARHWHFLGALFWLLNGLIFVLLVFPTGEWRRLIPQSWEIFPAAWKTFVVYACFHMPEMPDTYKYYDPLQKLAYGSIIFVFPLLSLMTGAAMSPAIANRFPWYTKLFGNWQAARSLHFLLAVNYVVFFLIHVSLVVLNGFKEGMNHILLNRDDREGMAGVYVAIGAFLLFLAVHVAANLVSRKYARAVQRLAGALVGRLMRGLLDPLHPQREHRREDISPFFWANGRLPDNVEEWKRLAADGFKDYRLEVRGLVENPMKLSLEEMRLLEKHTQITEHHCIQGWSGVAAWTGLPMWKILEMVRPLPAARYAVFYSFAEGPEGGVYYDSDPIDDLKHPQTLLAYEMNFEPLGIHHGAPLRLRLENKLGFKMVKWIKAIEFVEDYRDVFEGQGGYHEDNRYYGYHVNI